MSRGPDHRLTPEERERIVELRLQRVPVRTVAEEVGTSTKTVVAVWQKYLQERAQRDPAELERRRAEVVLRLEQTATDARRAYVRAMRDSDMTAARGFLAEERNALMALSRIDGLDVQRVEHSGEVGGVQILRIVESVDED